MNYPKLQCFLLFILLTFCFNLTFSAGAILDISEEQESEEFENALVENMQKDYRNGFAQLVNFVNLINNTITDLKRQIGLQHAEIAGQKAEIADQKAEIAGQKAEIVDLKSKIADKKLENTSLDAKISSQNADITELKRVVTLLHNTNPILAWKDFIYNLTWIPRTGITTGTSFNGSTLPDIKSRASQVGYRGSYTVVVFVNHLNEAIQDLKIHDPYNYTNNPAPKCIPPHTQEIFTFAKSSRDVVRTSFSYAIPSARIRLGAISFGGTNGAGLAFVSKDADMETYYRTERGIKGSWVYEERYATDKNLSVSYKDLRARLFADYEGGYKATLRIELIELPL